MIFLKCTAFGGRIMENGLHGKSKNQEAVSFFETASYRSGKRDSNSRPSAWEANALPTELLPHFVCKCNVFLFYFIKNRNICLFSSK